MSTLAADLHTKSASFPTRCHVAFVLADPDLDEDRRQVIREAIADKRITATHISDRLKEHGIDLSDHSIRRHRNKRCRCE